MDSATDALAGGCVTLMAVGLGLGMDGKFGFGPENVGYIPKEIAIFHRDNDEQNHWVQWGTNHFQTRPLMFFLGKMS